MKPDESHSSDEQIIARLLAAAERDAAPPDRAFLDKLRGQSLASFEAAGSPTQSTSPGKRTMLSSIRWIATGLAATLMLGLVLAKWVGPWILEEKQGPEDKFALGEKLIDDGRIGKVTDLQGVTAVRPVLHERWSPAQRGLVLKPGDWLRTDSRGGNAIAVKLVNAANAIVGPHSTVELVKPGELHLIVGEIEITAADNASVELQGPDKAKVEVKGTRRFRVEKDKLVALEKEPLWLRGFKGSTADESIGSLVASIDGRDVPLTVGYHRVTVDIRDQIARTTIEESFVNRTPHVLEGVFHFPLPQDASISGFGMWIGDQLVEADVVEKQRAREIYETILREKRDPGLLEWTGGNIFKARVYPIPGLSEKRIKITYTQVLPLAGNRYRYSYGLQSEMLKQHPLRELSIDVKVNSGVPLKEISSPTHNSRVAKTEHSGHVEFSAQEYTPTRDFEAVVELEGRQSDVVVVPHRRGEDGYFMVQLMPPGAGGDWERPLVSDGSPMRLLLLADTSASMDKGQRASQEAVLASLLGALTPKDTLNVAACDVNCDWIFEKPVPATPENIATIRQALAKRSSLGWTDLDKAFASAMRMSDGGTQVVYIGDGIVTTGDADPVAFANRLRKLYEGKAGTFHAITVGSSYEPAALKAIASLGGGSVRRVGGEKGPQTAALELLSEIAAPALRDLKVSFNGFRTARVYPEDLPNVAAGTQQILLGRYLPDGGDQTGEIIVTGTLGAKPVRYTSKVSFKDAEKGNSFIPRLWARMHLDKLLEQGSSEAIKQEIIGLSEEFNIITPYTSLLVLESDADRERFAVKRRFQMRDGERFFADGRDNAQFELKQKQMKQAGDYRTALRRKVLAQLLTMGRDATIFQSNPRYPSRSLTTLAATPASGEMNAGIAGGSGGGFGWSIQDAEFLGDELDSREILEGQKRDEEVDEKEAAKEMWSSPPISGKPMAGLPVNGYVDNQDLGLNLLDTDHFFDGMLEKRKGLAGDKDGLYSLSDLSPSWAGRKQNRYFAQQPYGYYPPPLPWIGSYFPSLAPPAKEAKEPKSTWPEPALALSRSLLRMDALAKIKGGIAIARRTDGFNRRDELVSRADRIELVSPTTWLGRTSPDGGQTMVSWCDAKERGVYSSAFLLGRSRASQPIDLKNPPLELADHSVAPLHASYAGSVPTVETIDKDRALLIVKYPNSPDEESRFLIDTDRRVLMGIERRSKGKPTSTVKFEDFVEVAGAWWARRVETLDEKGRRLSLATQTIEEVDADAFAQRIGKELAGKHKVLFLKQPAPSVAGAKAAVAAGKATFDDRVVLTIHFAATQEWARAQEHLKECERLAAGKRGMRWLVNAYLLAGRKHEELRGRLLADATELAGTTDADALANSHFLAEQLIGQAQQVLQVNEALSLNDNLRKVYERQSPHLQAMKQWRNRRVSLLQQAGQADQSLALAKELAVEYPRDYSMHTQYARLLSNAGDFPAAYAWLDRVLAADSNWDASEEEQLRGLHASMLEQQARYRDLASYLEEWFKRNPVAEHYDAVYLSALVRSGQVAKAEGTAKDWLKAAQIPGDLPPHIAARLRAAVNFALGQAHNLHSNRLLESWHEPLATTALYFAREGDKPNIVSTVLQNYRFQSTDAGRAARRTLAGILKKDIASLPLERIHQLVIWAWSDSGMEGEDWPPVAAELRKRWDAEKDPEKRHRIAQTLVRVLGIVGSEPSLEFLRVQWKQGPETHRAQYARELFEALLARHWTTEGEEELFVLLDKMAETNDPSPLRTRVAALHRLTDTMLEARYQARMKTVEHSEKRTRTELQKLQDDFRRQAREGFTDRLRTEEAKQASPFTGWLAVERLCIEVLLERNLAKAAEECWRLIEGMPLKAKPEEAEPTVEEQLDEVLRGRLLAMLQNLAARKGADAASIDRLLKYIDDRMKESPANGQWKAEKYRLLIALDRPKDLEAELARWIASPDSENRWKLALGYLLAEQGKVAEAIKLLEAVEAADELSPRDYRSLADWYLVENRRTAYEKARVASYKTADEYSLSRRISVFLHPWQRHDGRLPTQLDPEVMEVFKALFEKSGSPANYLWQLQQFYQASRDFRLLAMLPDGVIGHSAGKVYPFLQGMGSVLSEVRDEATADELVARIAALRPAAKTAIDQRALDLLELLVERRAAEVQNQPGPHGDKALDALERAFKREWSPGEPRLMADFLAALGTISRPAMVKVQLAQLDRLRRDAAAGSFDRLHITQRHAETLSGYGRGAEATDILQAALKEFEDANKGVLPVSANSALGVLIGFMENARHYDQGERLLLGQLKHPVHAEQAHWLTQRLNNFYIQALRNNGTVTLGAGAVLYKAIEAKLFADLASNDQNHRQALFGEITRLYRTAHERQIAGVAEDLKAFAFKRLPTILKEQVVQYENVVGDVANAVHDIASPRDGIAFLLDRVEDEPGWLRYFGQDNWQWNSHRFGEWRTQVKDLGDLEPRLLNYILAELRRDLHSREQRYRALYDRRHNYYWEAKSDAFAKAAEEIYAERKASGPSVEYIAEYLFFGLPREGRAIEILFAAHQEKQLEESGQWQLVDYLHRTKRYAESIPVLLPMVETRPDNLGYRTKLMHAYYRTGRQAELLALLKQTHAYFHEKNRWDEGAMAALASSCLENRLFAQSASYFGEVIPLHQRTHPRRGIGNGTLSGYYAGAADAYAGLGKTKEAVDMACGAVVSWTSIQQQRKDALEALVRVLVAAPDLGGYVAGLDKEKLQSAVIRKAIGKAYIRKEDHARAIPQLRLAAELQPNDAEVYEALTACYDRIGDKEGAVRQLLEAVELSRRDNKLYEQLGNRLADLKQSTEAERAYTSIVEMQANESESHALLAEIREKQNRWPEAIHEWKRVAVLRALEPTGLLKLAAAQIHEKLWTDAAETLRTLRTQGWPQRFGDVQHQVRELEGKFKAGRR